MNNSTYQISPMSFICADSISTLKDGTKNNSFKLDVNQIYLSDIVSRFNQDIKTATTSALPISRDLESRLNKELSVIIKTQRKNSKLLKDN